MKNYWRSIEEHDQPERAVECEPEFSVSGITESEIKGKETTSRRDFLKILGFSVGYAALATGCETPIRKAIPFLIKPEEIVPGVANYYASTFYDGHDYASILVKTREGRPIKAEANEMSAITGRGISARVQASVLSLYDNTRLKHPLKNNIQADWSTVDTEIESKLNELNKKGEKIAILASSVISPSTRQVFSDFKKKFPATEIFFYDSVSFSGILEANLITFGTGAIPSYYFNKADLIVSFGADFLGTWISPAEYTKQYAEKRKINRGNPEISKHVQFESTLSLTGSNADYRIPVNPSEEGHILLNLYNTLVMKAGKKTVPVRNSDVNIGTLADELWQNKGRSLVVSGSNNINTQITVNAINMLLENYGSTIDLTLPVYYKRGIDSEMKNLISGMESKEIKAVILYNVNPAYDYPQAERFTEALAKVQFSVSFAETPDETAKLCTYVCPDCHYLESWNDAEPKKNSFSLCQPVINKLFDTRQAQESLLRWCAVTSDKDSGDKKEETNALFYEYIRKYWETNIFDKQKEYIKFTDFWNNSLQKGVFELPDVADNSVINFIISEEEFSKRMAELNSEIPVGFEYTVYENIGIGTGKHANNPWLQELPDPVSKVCWDNYVAVSYNFASKYNLKLGDIVIVDNLFELPVLIQPGQADNTISVALGYGRTSAGKVAGNLGKNAYKLVKINKTREYNGHNISIVPTGNNYIFALTQTHHTMEGRDHVRCASLADYKNNPYAGNEKHVELMDKKETLYEKREFNGHHWGLAIDLNLCTGCSACVIACQAENNVAVVGRDEVRNKRIMHWLRLDRYYAENPVNPEVFFQPVMCQHCDSAPCENVCPVEATQNSMEGLNEMAYNRCIGTRYCMNNCPYRVRRFNWFEYGNNQKFDYNMNSNLGKMVLNPDVVVRTRGVVEKCSFCVQRIQEAKLIAKNENRELKDGDIRPACMQSCPASAMVFGDLNMPGSAISNAFADERNYFLLEEVNTSPSVGYMTKIKNRNKKETDV